VGERTRLIAVCNPNNPTGAILSRAEMEEISRIADRVGAWVLADEVYRGAELVGEETPTFLGSGERVLVTSGLSKAYGLPGLRIGWVAAPPRLVRELWRYKDYTTIGPGALSDRLARHALDPDTRKAILDRARRLLSGQYAFIAKWLAARADLFEFVPPRAGAFVYVRYRPGIGSTRLAERLRDRHGVLVVPGDHFGMDGHLRIGYGVERELLERGLAALEEELRAVDADAATGEGGPA
jgi:aspartate/methionine/tyrosine aminotransferase